MKTDTILMFALIGFIIYHIFFKNKSCQSSYEMYEPVDTSQKDYVDIQESDDIQEEYPKYNKCPQFLSTDLLPKRGEVTDYSEFSPETLDDNFLNGTRYISSQSTNLRNANRSIRPDPEIPHIDVCPWNKSTIDRTSSEPSEGNYIIN